jgi:hypothetical protein
MTPPAVGSARPAPSTAPARRPPGPRRVSGPARRPAPAAAPPLRRVVDHPLLDRLIRGRMWIGIVAFALIGIVTMEVALLKLNAGIGRSVERAATLQRANSLLASQVSALQAGHLQQAQAAGPGMVYDPAGDVRYLTAGDGDAAAAAGAMVAPGQATPQTSATGVQTPAADSQAAATSAQPTPLSTGSSQAVTTPAAPAASGGATVGASAAPASSAGIQSSSGGGGVAGVAGGAVAAPGG